MDALSLSLRRRGGLSQLCSKTYITPLLNLNTVWSLPKRALRWAAIITESSCGSSLLDFCQYSWWIPADFAHWSQRFLWGAPRASPCTVHTHATGRNSFVRCSLCICANADPSTRRETSKRFVLLKERKPSQRKNAWEAWSAKKALSPSTSVIVQYETFSSLDLYGRSYADICYMGIQGNTSGQKMKREVCIKADVKHSRSNERQHNLSDWNEHELKMKSYSVLDGRLI